MATKADQARLKRYYKQNRSKILEQSTQYYHDNRDEIAAKRKAKYDPVLNRDRALRKAYGISLKEWETLFEAQGRQCAICQSPVPKSKKGWVTDHDHVTMRIRGILCLHCNVGLGYAQDRPDVLRAMARYLEDHKHVL